MEKNWRLPKDENGKTIFWHDLTYANQRIGTDTNPYEILIIVSGTTLEIREMDCKELEWKKDFHVGGFFGHVSNQKQQRWDIQSNPNNPRIRIRLVKCKYQEFDKKTRKWVDAYEWRDKNGIKYYLSNKPVKFYDYNF